MVGHEVWYQAMLPPPPVIVIAGLVADQGVKGQTALQLK